MPLSPDQQKPPGFFKAKIAGYIWSITPHCREVARLTSEAREHPLPLGMRTRLGVHRLFCEWCARYEEQLDFLGEASQRLPEHLDEASGTPLGAEARERMKRALRDSSPG